MKRFCVALVYLLPLLAFAEIKTQNLIYKNDGQKFEGYVAYDDSLSGVRPGVLVIHEWKGINAHVKNRVEELARLGYVAFAPDIYGVNVRPSTAEEAAAAALVYKKDRGLMRARALLAVNELRKFKNVDKKKVAAIGFCFGGTVALELARSGADILGAVSFHGGLDTPNPKDAEKIKAKVLVLHGANDPFVPEKQVQVFESEMRAANVDWQLIKYSGAVHAFTNPAAGKDGIEGAAYHKVAATRSWQALQTFFQEIFSK